MELIGTAKKVFDTQTFDSGFQKRSLILLTEEQYPQPINIEFLGDKVGLLDNVAEGSQLKVGINIRGREWQAPDGEVKYFNSIVGWRIEKADAGGTANTPSQPTPLASNQTSASEDTNVFDEEEEDDLPF